jgi:peroxidase
MRSRRWHSVVAVALAAAAWWWCAAAQAQAQAQLSQSYYASTCPDVETLVRGAVTQKLQETFNAAPGTLRLFFHDCFVRVRTPSVVVLHARPTLERWS